MNTNTWLESRVRPIELISAECATMMTVPLRMFDESVNVISYEIVNRNNMIKVLCECDNVHFLIEEYFGDSVDTDPWMGEGLKKQSIILKWIISSITFLP